jgi:hypothetical protein
MVKRPMADRAPMGYQREFLDGYTPGVTQYLTESLRRHLSRDFGCVLMNFGGGNHDNEKGRAA